MEAAITEHISPVLYDLHWLTVKNRIIFKILLITFKALHGLAPGYLSDLITPYRPSRSLRSMVANLLILPKCRTKTYGERAFAVAGPTLWNSLPQFMRELTSVNQFKAHLKTYPASRRSWVRIPLSHMNFSGSCDNCLSCPASARIISSFEKKLLLGVFICLK